MMIQKKFFFVKSKTLNCTKKTGIKVKGVKTKTSLMDLNDFI